MPCNAQEEGEDPSLIKIEPTPTTSPNEKTDDSSSSNSSSPSVKNGSISNGSSTSQLQPPIFIESLRQMLDSDQSEVRKACIQWSRDGRYLEITDSDLLTAKLLPTYFRQTKYASFQRQLNYFGFRKRSRAVSRVCTYFQPNFNRSMPERMVLIKRRKSAAESPIIVSAEDSSASWVIATLQNSSYYWDAVLGNVASKVPKTAIVESISTSLATNKTEKDLEIFQNNHPSSSFDAATTTAFYNPIPFNHHPALFLGYHQYHQSLLDSAAQQLLYDTQNTTTSTTTSSYADQLLQEIEMEEASGSNE